MWRMRYRRQDRCYHILTPNDKIWMACPTWRGAMQALYLAHRSCSSSEYDAECELRRNVHQDKMHRRIHAIWAYRACYPDDCNAFNRMGKPR